MGTQTDYFNKIGYKPKYYIGDRVFGHWKKIPFIGTVGNDAIISLEEGPRITVHLDLPIELDGVSTRMLVLKHRDIKRLIDYDVADEKAAKLKLKGKK